MDFRGLGHARRQAGDLDGMRAAWMAAAARAPDDPAIWADLGAGGVVAGDDRAGRWLGLALRLAPAVSTLWYNLGLWAHRRDPDRARAAYVKALILAPADLLSWHNLAQLEQFDGNLAAALHAVGRAMAAAPDQTEPRILRGFLRLMAGDYPGGFADYEARESAGPTRAPLWRGEALTGRRLLLRAEQGFGDTIQMLRYVPRLIAAGARILLAAPPPLQGLAARLPGVELDDGGPVDADIGLMSLPHRLGTTIFDIPGTVPYLAPPPGPAPDLGPGFNIGIAWAGNPAQGNDFYRSMRLADLAPLRALAGVRLFSLQKDVPARDRATLDQWRDIVDLGGGFADFDDTARMIQALDLVISVDSAVAHLAGALARPVWVCLGFSCDWRYGRIADSTPWYPSMRLFRQRRPGDWDGPVAEMINTLKSLPFFRGRETCP